MSELTPEEIATTGHFDSDCGARQAARIRAYGDQRFRDGLEAACRAACWRCGEGHAVMLDDDEWMHVANMGIAPEPCEAAPIRRLIAEQEGKDAQTPTT